jgi:hypothetical protein
VILIERSEIVGESRRLLAVTVGADSGRLEPDLLSVAVVERSLRGAVLGPRRPPQFKDRRTVVGTLRAPLSATRRSLRDSVKTPASATSRYSARSVATRSRSFRNDHLADGGHECRIDSVAEASAPPPASSSGRLERPLRESRG